ncbi:MAG: hypothetical protein HGA65_17830 [Oscillochloris sp.]|nr:hypothetical protein [Oscillochloris sp.]
MFNVDTLISDLITYCKRDLRLPEQDSTGEMIRYAFYRKQGVGMEKLNQSHSLRILRIKKHEDLFLANEGRIWWQGAPSSLHTPPPVGPGTEPLNPHPPVTVRPPPPANPPKPPIPPPSTYPVPSSCSVELAPNCVFQVPEIGLKINREYLIQNLPMSVSARERALVLVGMQSRLEAVSRSTEGHCMLIYRQHWYLVANHTIYIGSNKHSHGEALPLEQTVTILLGRAGWPITIRLHSTVITR